MYLPYTFTAPVLESAILQEALGFFSGKYQEHNLDLGMLIAF